eukprot:7297349-Alexandrium_andersonii.AAC.1
MLDVMQTMTDAPSKNIVEEVCYMLSLPLLLVRKQISCIKMFAAMDSVSASSKDQYVNQWKAALTKMAGMLGKPIVKKTEG